jgi:hypothetical protein
VSTTRARLWTPDEDAELNAVSSYAEYASRGGTRSAGSCASRRCILKQQGVEVPHWERGGHAAWAKERVAAGMQLESSARVQLESQLELPERDGLPIDRYYSLVKQISDVTRERKAETKVIEWTAPTDGWIGIAFPGDLHIGGPIDYQRLEDDLDLIEATDGLWCVGLGDYSNNFQAAAKLLKAMAEDVVPGSEDQMELVAHVMRRTTKWLAILEGNHDTWSGSAGLKKLSQHLGAVHIAEAGCSLKVTTGHQRYVGYLKHQWKGHSNLNTSNESRRMWNEFPEWENADFTVLAHYHQPDTHSKEIKTQTVTHLRGGTYKSYDPYASKNGYVPEYGIPLVLLNPHEKEIITYHARNWRRGVEHLGWLRGY